MNPDERELLQRTITLGEENNKILLKVQKNLKWQAIWSIIKILVLVVPLVLGYVFFQPIFGSMFNSYKDVQSLINNPESGGSPTTKANKSTNSSSFLDKFIKSIN